MPGVPSSKACDACRKQKKKCDEKSPSCSRCIRLGLECIGSGQQRYKFQQQQPCATNKIHKTHKTSFELLIHGRPDQKQTAGYIAAILLKLPPSNELTLLTSQYVQIVRLTTNLKYNLAWAYGPFLFDIPRRMCTNEALDNAVYALVAAHSDFCSSQGASVLSLKSYSHSLKVLSQTLDDPAKASTPETLCAVMLLLLCQALNGVEDCNWSGHCEGVVTILKARSFKKPQNEFEQRLLLTLRGPVLFEGLLNDKISLTPEEWTSLVGNELDSDLPEGQMLRQFAHIPNIIQRGRIATTKAEIATLREQTKPLYQASKPLLDQLHANWTKAPPHNAHDSLGNVITHAYYQRVYGTGLMMMTIMNAILDAFTPKEETDELKTDAKFLINEVLKLAQQANIYRPLGTGYMVTALTAAWIAATDETEKRAAKMWLYDYRHDFPLLNIDRFESELHWKAKLVDGLRLDRWDYD